MCMDLWIWYPINYFIISNSVNEKFNLDCQFCQMKKVILTILSQRKIK